MENTKNSEIPNLYNNNFLTAETIHSLKKALSKTGTAILKELYFSPQMQHKALAATMHTTPASLCNILKRIDAIQPPLLIHQRNGRTKQYSLTETARLYIAQVLQLENTQTYDSSRHASDLPILNDSLHILYQFQESAGEAWYLAFDDFLSGQNNNDEKLHLLFSNFILSMKRLMISKQDHMISEVYNALKQPILTKRLENRLENELSGYYDLDPLFELEKLDFESVFHIIDYIFARISPTIFNSIHFPSSFKGIPFSEACYYRILSRISKMTEDFTVYQGNKAKVLEHWKDVYLSTNISLCYIAEKGYIIYWHVR